jgi:PAS domain S-box-containing protein
VPDMESVQQQLPRGQRRFYDRELAGVYRTTVDGSFVDCNEAMARILGYGSRDELLAEQAPHLPFDDRGTSLEALRLTGTVAGEEGWLRRRDGRPVAVVYSEQLRTGPDGAELVEGTLIDVTRRRGQGAHDRVLAGLACGVAHRVTEPLSSLVANLGFALETLGAVGRGGGAHDGELALELDRALRDAKSGADALRGVVRDLAVFAQSRSGADEAGDLSRLVESALAVAAAELGGRARVETSLLHDLSVKGADAPLGRCLLQLLLEASDAMTDGARDHLLRVATWREGPLAVLEVEDTRQGAHRDAGFGLLQTHLLVASMGGRLVLTAGERRCRLARIELPLE